jgi:hypothetical protein
MHGLVCQRTWRIGRSGREPSKADVEKGEVLVSETSRGAERPSKPIIGFAAQHGHQLNGQSPPYPLLQHLAPGPKPASSQNGSGPEMGSLFVAAGSPVCGSRSFSSPIQST